MVLNPSFARRDFLGLAGSAVATAGLTGVAAGSEPDRVRVNVGYSAQSGRRAARSAADEIVHEFGFDALTLLTTPTEARRLAARGGVEYVESDPRVEAIGIREILGGLTDGGLGGGLTGGGFPGGGLTGGGLPGGGFTGDDSTDGTTAGSSAGASASGTSVSASAPETEAPTTAAQPGDGYLSQVVPWGIEQINADDAHANGHTGDGAHIAVIDTGIDLAHVDLLGNLGLGATTLGAAVTDTALPAGGQDDNGHGTHLAGTAAAADNGRGVVGVAPDATLHPVKALLANGVGLASDVAKAIEHAAQRGWDVANLSLGGAPSNVLEAAVDSHKNDVVLVAAAGNNGGTVSHPAAYDGVVAVGASDRNDDSVDFSPDGAGVLAPGVDIYSSYLANTYMSLAGTSMAAAHVSGAAAQLIGDLSVEAVRTRLQNPGEVIDVNSLV